MKNLCLAEEYERRGEKKVRWLKVGELFEKSGKQFIKIFTIPNLIHVFEEKAEKQPTQPIEF
jgi:hypothetical protein